MNECTFDRLDALISLGARSLVDKEAGAFLQMESDCEIDSKVRRKNSQDHKTGSDSRSCVFDLYIHNLYCVCKHPQNS